MDRPSVRWRGSRQPGSARPGCSLFFLVCLYKNIVVVVRPGCRCGQPDFSVARQGTCLAGNHVCGAGLPLSSRRGQMRRYRLRCGKAGTCAKDVPRFVPESGCGRLCRGQESSQVVPIPAFASGRTATGAQSCVADMRVWIDPPEKTWQARASVAGRRNPDWPNSSEPGQPHESCLGPLPWPWRMFLVIP